MKRFIRATTAALLLTVAAGCGEEAPGSIFYLNKTGDVVRYPWSGPDTVAVISLGSVDQELNIYPGDVGGGERAWLRQEGCEMDRAVIREPMHDDWRNGRKAALLMHVYVCP